MYIKKKLLAPVNFNGTLRKPKNDKFGAIRSKIGGALRKHAGVDLYDKKGAAVKAAFSGKIIRASKNHIYGGLVIIDHSPDHTLYHKPSERQYTYTLYAHLDSTTVTFGQKVELGEKIATVGNSENAAGMKPHLHFEIIKSKGILGWNKTGNTGVGSGLHRVDPLPYLNGHSIILGEINQPHETFFRRNPMATRHDLKRFTAEDKIPQR